MNGHTPGGYMAAGLALLCLATSIQPGCAAMLRDPTRPAQARVHVAAAGTTLSHLPVLESVLLLPGYKAAIIDGETVMLGSMFRGARLVALAEKTAWLRKGAKTQVLHLAPPGPDTVPALAAAPAHSVAAMEKTN